MATPYARGRAFEYRVKKHFEKAGYQVTRSYASKGVADLKALKPLPELSAPGFPYAVPKVEFFIQAKLGGKISPLEWNTLLDTAHAAGSVPILAYKDEKRKLVFWRITGRNVPHQRNKPMEPFTP